MKNKKNSPHEQTPGRPRIAFPVLESIGSAASILGIPESLIKAAKRAGSKAFISGSRIDTGILIPDLFAELLKSKTAEKLDLNTERAGLAREQKLAIARENAIANKQIYRLEVVEEMVWTGILSPVFNDLTALEKKAHRLKYDPAVCVEIVRDDFPRVRAKVASSPSSSGQKITTTTK